MKYLTVIIANLLFGRIRFQALFRKLQLLSFQGQNYYNALDLSITGEKLAVQIISENLRIDKNKGEKWIVIDAGAHEGIYSDFLFSDFQKNKEESTFYLIEPQRRLYSKLVEKYSCYSAFKIFDFAVSDANNKSKELFYSKQYDKLATLLPIKLQDFSKGRFLDLSIFVPTIRLDEFVMSQSLDYVDILKLDIEGLEYIALNSLQRNFNSGKFRCIQFEYSFMNIVSKDFFYDFWILLSDNYYFFRIVKDGLYRIKDYSLEIETLAPINYVLFHRSISISDQQEYLKLLKKSKSS